MSPGPWGGERFSQVVVVGKPMRARFGWDSRGFLPGQAAELRGKRYTIHDRRRLGFTH